LEAVRRYGWAAAVCGAVILAVGFFLQAMSFAAPAGQAMTAGTVILVFGVVVLAVGAVIRR